MATARGKDGTTPADKAERGVGEAGKQRAAGLADTVLSEAKGAKEDVKDVFADAGVTPSKEGAEDAATRVAELLKKAFVPTVLFEEYLGTTTTLVSRAALQLRDQGSLLSPGDKGDLETLRKGRVTVLAQRLEKRLERFTQGDKAGFAAEVEAEAKSLASIPFGAPLLHVIGYIYQEAAQPLLGSAVGSFVTRIAHKTGTGVTALVGKMNLGLMKVDVKISNYDAAEILHYLEERLPGAITAIWNVLTAEAEAELREITGLVLQSGSAPAEQLRHKAEALFRLGEIFSEAKAPDRYLAAPEPERPPLTTEDVKMAASQAATQAAQHYDAKGQPGKAAVAGAASEAARGETPALYLHGAAYVQGAADGTSEALEDAGPKLREGIAKTGSAARRQLGDAASQAQQAAEGAGGAQRSGAGKPASPEQAVDAALQQVAQAVPPAKGAAERARPVAAPLAAGVQEAQPQLEEVAGELARQAGVVSEAAQRAYHEPERAGEHLASAAKRVTDGLVEHKDAAADVVQTLAGSAKPAADEAQAAVKETSAKHGPAAKDTAAQVKQAASQAEALAERVREADAERLRQAGYEAIEKAQGLGDQAAQKLSGEQGAKSGGPGAAPGAKGQKVAGTAAEGAQGVADTAAEGAQRVAGIADDTAQDLGRIGKERGKELQGKLDKISADTSDAAKGLQGVGQDAQAKATELGKRGKEEIVKPAARNVGEGAPQVGRAVGDEVIRPMGKRVAEDAEPAAQAVASDIRKAGDVVHEKAVPVTEDYAENLLKPTAKWTANSLQLQARAVAKEAGSLAGGLPGALRKGVHQNRVPKDLMPDLLHLAELLEPLVAEVKATAEKLPAAAEAVGKHIEPAADAVAKAAVDTAKDASAKAQPAAETAATALENTARDVAHAAPQQAEQASEAVEAGATEAGARLKEAAAGGGAKQPAGPAPKQAAAGGSAKQPGVPSKQVAAGGAAKKS